MRRSFLLVTRVFDLYLFPWRHWEITSDRFLIIFHQDHLLFPMELYDLYLSFILQDIRGWSFLFARFQCLLDKFVSFLYFFRIERFLMICVPSLKDSLADSFTQFRFIFFVVITYFSVVKIIFREAGSPHWGIFFFKQLYSFVFGGGVFSITFSLRPSILAFRFDMQE